jgi:chaperonin GroEL (HSP60 family)
MFTPHVSTLIVYCFPCFRALPTIGLSVDRGYLSPYFVKDSERQVCEMVNPRILVTDKKITSVQDLVPLLEQMVKTKEPLFIVAEDVTGEALSALVVNKLRGVLDIVAIKAPSFGDRRKAYLQDMAIATGATYVADEVGGSGSRIVIVLAAIGEYLHSPFLMICTVSHDELCCIPKRTPLVS